MNRKIDGFIEKSLHFFEDKNNTVLDYSILSESEVSGPTVVISGAIHGSEVVGVEAMITFLKFFDEGRFKLKRGRVLWILGNPDAFGVGLRLIDENLNRLFHKNTELPQTNEGRRAYDIQEFIRDFSKRHTIDYLLDIHSFSTGNLSFALCSEEKNHFQKLLTLSNLEKYFTFSYDQLPGTFIEFVNKLGGMGYAVECGNNNDEHTIESALYHIHALLTQLRMIEGEEIYPQDTMNSNWNIIHYTALETIHLTQGFRWLEPSRVYFGKELQKGDVYAKSTEKVYQAPDDCVIFLPDLNPSPSDTDAGFLCKVETKKR